MADRRQLMLYPLVKEGALVPGPRKLSCSVGGHEYFAGGFAHLVTLMAGVGQGIGLITQHAFSCVDGQRPAARRSLNLLRSVSAADYTAAARAAPSARVWVISVDVDGAARA